MRVGAGHEKTQEVRDAIRVLLSHEYYGELTEWEETFVESVQVQAFLSDKQLVTFWKVFDEVTSGSRHEHDEDYDEHDFYGDD